jgi:hypothetical protein
MTYSIILYKKGLLSAFVFVGLESAIPSQFLLKILLCFLKFVISDFASLTLYIRIYQNGFCEE